MWLRNINPMGRADLPIVRREGDIPGEGRGCLEPGEVFEVPDSIGAALLEQAGNYEAAETPAADGKAKR